MTLTLIFFTFSRSISLWSKDGMNNVKTQEGRTKVFIITSLLYSLLPITLYSLYSLSPSNFSTPFTPLYILLSYFVLHTLFSLIVCVGTVPSKVAFCVGGVSWGDNFKPNPHDTTGDHSSQLFSNYFNCSYIYYYLLFIQLLTDSPKLRDEVRKKERKKERIINSKN